MPWITEEWSRGVLLGLTPDPNTGYRATVWFEYTRALFNEIREGSLIAIRNFSDRPQHQHGTDAARDTKYEEYSILQIDQVHPWHYAIQEPGERGYPAFTVAAAQSARQDWTEYDVANRDDVSRIRCEAIPLRLAFRYHDGEASDGGLPEVFMDRSKPMPGYEAWLISERMTNRIVNQGLEDDRCISVGQHLVQRKVDVKLSVPELLSLHFGVFGFTGAGKSNLISTIVRLALGKSSTQVPGLPPKFVIFDLLDEYTGLLIDQLVSHPASQLIVAGRDAVDEKLLRGCEHVTTHRDMDAQRIALDAARSWSNRIVLPVAQRLQRLDFQLRQKRRGC